MVVGQCIDSFWCTKYLTFLYIMIWCLYMYWLRFAIWDLCLICGFVYLYFSDCVRVHAAALLASSDIRVHRWVFWFILAHAHSPRDHCYTTVFWWPVRFFSLFSLIFFSFISLPVISIFYFEKLWNKKICLVIIRV